MTSPSMAKKTRPARVKRTCQRNQHIAREFNRLFNIERIRADDCIKQLASTFYLSPRTITKILQKTSID